MGLYDGGLIMSGLVAAAFNGRAKAITALAFDDPGAGPPLVAKIQQQP
jgi:hypothetical protein